MTKFAWSQICILSILISVYNLQGNCRGYRPLDRLIIIGSELEPNISDRVVRVAFTSRVGNSTGCLKGGGSGEEQQNKLKLRANVMLV